MTIRTSVDSLHTVTGDGISNTFTFDLKIIKAFPFDLALVSPSSVVATDLTGTTAITTANTGTSVTLTFATAFNGNKRVGLSVFFG